VKTLATLRHARALAEDYRHVYGVDAKTDWLTTAVLWRDALLASTLPFRADGSCGPEPSIAGAPAHHVLGLAAGILRHLPPDLLFVIAAAQSPDPARICSWLQAAAIVAEGRKLACPTRQTVEAFIHHLANADTPLLELSWSRYVARAPKGWARYDALREDGNDLLLFSRSP
jgi:hypothetical protein